MYICIDKDKVIGISKCMGICTSIGKGIGTIGKGTGIGIGKCISKGTVKVQVNIQVKV